MINIAERHQFIISKVQKEGYVNVLDLCKALDVSSVTIRKDLKLLEDKNLLFRTHGGATLNNPYMTDRPVNEKEKLQRSEEHTSELQSLMRISYAVFCLKKKKIHNKQNTHKSRLNYTLTTSTK